MWVPRSEQGSPAASRSANLRRSLHRRPSSPPRHAFKRGASRPHSLTALAPIHMLRRAEPSEAYPPSRRLRRVFHLAVIHGFTPVAFCEGGSKHPGFFGTFSSYRQTIGDSHMVRVGVSSIEKSGIG
jgi:hypothetical protein